jgi:CelD/BcsL family acetyltransferase involved in cellulose biosynthesis
MATTDVGNGAAFVAADRFEPRLSLWPAPRYVTEIFDGADEALAALEAVQGGLVSTAFQTLDWLTMFYEELASPQHAMPRLVVVTDRKSGEVALILPLLIQKKRRRTIARFANVGIGGYGGPVLGPDPLERRRPMRRIWRSVLRAMPDVDLIRLDRMPAEIGGRPNPLLSCWGIVPASRSGNLLALPDNVQDYLRERGKKYRKEVERCYRLWEKEGSPRFYRADTPEDAARVYTVLEEQHAARYGVPGRKFILDDPPYRAFYDRLAIDGSAADLASLFALEANGEIIATLFGISHDDTFTLLHLGTSDAWSRLSPGRLIIFEAMRYLVYQGVRRFDMVLGDHPFKRSFGAEEVPLYDLILARDIAVVPRAVFHRLKGRFRNSPRMRAARRLLRANFAGKSAQ